MAHLGLLTSVRPGAATSVTAAASAASRAGSTAAFRPAAGKQGLPAGRPLSHNARSFSGAAAAAVEAPPTPVVATAPSVDGDRDNKSINDAGLQFKFLVPSSVVGAVLGRGGNTVASIKRETGAYVQFTRPGTATNSPRERMMIVAVERREQLAKAVSMVLQAMESEGALDKLRTKPFAVEKYFFQQVIPAMCAGKVMGPGGEAIKALSERSGCSVVVEGKSPNAAFVPFRLVNYLSPGPTQIAAAVAEVVELVCQEEKYEQSIRELSSVCFRIIEIPERRVGALLGPSGSHIKTLQEVLRCKMGVADASNKVGSRFVSIWGSPLNVKVAVDVVLLSTGLLSQQMNGGDGGTPPGTPRSGSVRFPASLSPSTAPSVTGDADVRRAAFHPAVAMRLAIVLTVATALALPLFTLAASHEDDVPLLLKQRDAITNWAELPAQYTQGWDAATPLCDWSRVECNEQEPGAVSYTLSFRCSGGVCTPKAQGGLAPELANCSYLTSLELANQALSGPLPAWGAGALPALQSLDLSNNQLTGTVPASWGEEGALPALTQLRLQGNPLCGIPPASLVNALCLSDPECATGPPSFPSCDGTPAAEGEQAAVAAAAAGSADTAASSSSSSVPVGAIVGGIVAGVVVLAVGALVVVRLRRKRRQGGASAGPYQTYVDEASQEMPASTQGPAWA
ncbi:Far upstream element-binding 2 [Micractinium conductrix]|uniref:Far upstream element-binding 2 n=1 Tax=Micractinium conductrix TaxID=554055 RepID=A0A2P6V5H9_9CHLO|nr:Far upstream element-binding 2 [Micractinium conductrix]|eukprot:PSC69332.1 Far upstream element-binding 2 [Micractinium conductrix]